MAGLQPRPFGPSLVDTLDKQQQQVYPAEIDKQERRWASINSTESEDYESDFEHSLAVDLLGRKHIDKTDGADESYTLLGDALIRYIEFPIPGNDSANTLRNSLRIHLPYCLITDEFGYIKPLNDISNRHLPTLQAKIWRDAPRNQASRLSIAQDFAGLTQNLGPFLRNPTKKDLENVSKLNAPGEDQILASHIKFIAELLDTGYIFVLHVTSDYRCCYPSCNSQHKKDIHTQVIKLEPMIDWGTVNPAPGLLVSRGKVVVFSRNAEKMNDPLWIQAVKRFTPKAPKAYCMECLEHLMSMRLRAWAIIDHPRDTGQRDVQPIERPRCAKELWAYARYSPLRSQKEEQLVIKLTTGIIKGCEVSSISSESRGSNEQVTQLALRLDGVSDSQHIKQHATSRRFSIGQHRWATVNSGDVSTYSPAKVCSPTYENRSRTVFPPANEQVRQFNKLQAQKPSDDITSLLCAEDSSCATADSFCFFPTTSSTNRTAIFNKKIPLRTRGFSRTGYIEPDLAQNIGIKGDLPIPDRQLKRKFGREMDTNAAGKQFPGYAEESTDVGKPNAPLPSIRGFFTATAKIPDPEGCRPTTTSDVKAAIARLVPLLCPGIAGFDLELEGVVETKGSYESEAQVPHATNGSSLPSYKNAKSALELLREDKRGKASPDLSTLFARSNRIKLGDIPDMISEEAYEAHKTYVPGLRDRICSCRKPTEMHNIKIAQCSCHECVIVWYHYNCLSKSEKLQANFGTMVCQQCRTELLLKTKALSIDHNEKETTDSTTSIPPTAGDMLASFPGTGGIKGTAKPYGLGIELPYLQATTPDKNLQEALGSPSFMRYSESKPHVVTAAYHSSETYAQDDQYLHVAEDKSAESIDGTFL